MKAVKEISITHFDYDLPEHRIARYPMQQRDASKLLVLKENQLSQTVFAQISNHLPANALLVLNETKVVQARLRFHTEKGAAVELFVLEPADLTMDFQVAYAQASPVSWNCLVGNSKRWKQGLLVQSIKIKDQTVELKAERIEKKDGYSVIRFSWSEPQFSFAEILDVVGETPLPPYLNRKAEPEDKNRYQTVFARQEGSVAAPTASLHFTDALMADLQKQGVKFEKLILHVGAGTFKPVSAAQIGEHEMHAEQIQVSRQFLQNLLENSNRPVIPVGTTAMRTLESLYWFGLMLYEEGLAKRDFHLDQWFPYRDHPKILSVNASLDRLIAYLDKNELDSFKATTALMIAPGYEMKIVGGLITNFHQPKSTLLLLVAALIGDKWKHAYAYALENDFRFLSYGDACLFIP
ncbi:MAG: S-adenosylmethionine:tRNA ribosyltransferase-isomerase [Bacteroidales bacterium]|jgi:S-adenosylmethionine:tRNA ribosyltransferase-isomerase|nr:S-adenosylmethionine:tRNA ribosyltransferase-isomerase [Bacteroidales bacterium]